MKIIKLLFCILLSFSLYAQKRPTKQFTTKEGLLSNDVSVLHVDSKSQLWVGSRAGLSVRTINGFRQDSISICFKFNNISSIVEDTAQDLWVASYGQGILYKNVQEPKLITKKDGLISDRVRRLKIFGDAIYAATNNGVSIISLKDYSIINPSFTKNPNFDFEVTDFYKYGDKIFATTINDGVFEVTPQRLIQFSDTKKVFSAVHKEGKIYLGTDKSIIKIDPQNGTIIDTYPISYAWKGIPYKNKILWVGSGLYSNEGGLYSVNTDNISFKKINKFPFSDLQTLAYDAKKDFLFVGTKNNGLIQVEIHSPILNFDEYGKTYASLNVRDTTVVVTEKGIIFSKEKKHISQISLDELKTYQLNNQYKFSKIATHKNHFYEIDFKTPSSKIIFYQTEIEDDNIWLSTNIGVFKINLEGKIKSYFPIHTYKFTFFKGKFFETNPYGGVRIYDEIDKMLYNYYHEQESNTIPRNIVSIDKDEESVYFASALDGLYTYKDGVFRSLLQEAVFTEAKLKKVTVLDRNKILIATDFNDIYFLNFEGYVPEVRLIIPNKKIIGNSISFFKTHKGIIYIGTNLGLNVIDNDKYFFIDREQGLDYTNINDGNFYLDDLHLSTSEGCFILDTDYFSKNKNSLQPIITRFIINNESWDSKKIASTFSDPHKVIDLKYEENNIRLYFDILNVKYPGKLKFSYRLKKDENWNLLSEIDKIDLHYLKRGLYELELKVNDLDSGKKKIFLLGTFRVNPPFYRTWTFIFFVIGFVMLTTFLIFKTRIKRLKKQQEREREVELLKVEQERKQLIFDRRIAEIRLQALSSQMNSHFLFNVLSSLQYYILGEDMDKALYYLDEFAKLIRRTLEYASKETITLKTELEYLEKYVEIENLRLSPKVVFEVVNDEGIELNQIEIPPLLLQPFVENSIIHAFPKSILNPIIKIIIKTQGNFVELIIQDNGVGFQEGNKPNHQSMGMSIVEERISLIKGNLDNKIDIKTSSKGTEIHMFLNKPSFTSKI